MKYYNPTFRFLRHLTIATVLIVAAVLLVAVYALHTAVPLSFWICLVFLLLLFGFVFQTLIKANQKKPQTFVTVFLGTLTGKLFLSAIVILVVGLIDRESLKFTAIAYFVAYVTFSFLEIKNLLPLIKNPTN